MSEEKETKQIPAEKRGNGNSSSPEDGSRSHHSAQARRDEEIAEMEQRSRYQPPTIQRPPEIAPASPRKAVLIVAITLTVLLVSGGATLLNHASHERSLTKATDLEAIPTVAIVHPLAEKPDIDLVLPGTLQAWEQSPIYARTNGYLLRWYKDIGSHVKEGELLATIDTPEIDQELDQARAARQQIVAQLGLAKISSERWENLRKSDSVSAQEADVQTSGYKESLANLAAADANVRRLEQLEGFKRVYAPFTGVLTQRNVDPGALINAGSTGGGSAGRELFDMARVDPLRVFTSVPQAYAPYIKDGNSASITLQEFPGEKFQAKIARTAEAIDPNTRTLLTEVDVPNKEERLLPGSFGEVHFNVGSNVNKVTVPVNAMLFRAQGAQLAVVGPDNKVQLRSITIGKDYGTTLEILQGVTVNDQVIINPPDSLEQGQKVNVAAAPPGEEQGQPSQQGQSEGKTQ
jgi:membrane fusion protein, multidrug efflux system